MNSSNYRNRLVSLENSIKIQPNTLFSRILDYKYYIVITSVIFLYLILLPPSFLVKKHKKKRNIKWILWISTWLVSSIIICVLYYIYSRQ
jgi:ABC-type sugar transport system permease subunit